MHLLIRTCQAVAVLILVGLWSCNVPYHQISDFVGSRFPWPQAKALRWPALLTEAALIQIMECLPVSLFAIVAFRRGALTVSTILASIFVIRSIAQLPSSIDPPYGSVFIIYIAVVQFVLLVGVAALWRRRITASNLSLQSTAVGAD